jgi:hypothetical protein
MQLAFDLAEAEPGLGDEAFREGVGWRGGRDSGDKTAGDFLEAGGGEIELVIGLVGGAEPVVGLEGETGAGGPAGTRLPVIFWKLAAARSNWLLAS